MSIVNELPLEERQRILDIRLTYWRNVMRMVMQIEELGRTLNGAPRKELSDDLDDIGLVNQVLGIVHSIASKKKSYLERLDGAVRVLLEADAEREAEDV